MFRVIVENKRGNKLAFTQNEKYTITAINGLGAPDAVINTADVGQFDGQRFNSSKVSMRNITMNIVISGDVETNRIALYQIFKAKEWIRFRYRNGLRDVYIDGYIESAPVNLFSQKQEVQVSILCPEPFFKAAEEIIDDMNLVISLFYFPFSFEESGEAISEYNEVAEKVVLNSGDIENGMIIELKAIGKVVNPKVISSDTLEFFGLNYTMENGDVILISTEKGNKTVRLIREGIETNIFNYIMKDISWLQLKAGDNVFVFEAEAGAEYLEVTFRHRNFYEGV